MDGGLLIGDPVRGVELIVLRGVAGVAPPKFGRATPSNGVVKSSRLVVLSLAAGVCGLLVPARRGEEWSSPAFAVEGGTVRGVARFTFRLVVLGVEGFLTVSTAIPCLPPSTSQSPIQDTDHIP